MKPTAKVTAGALGGALSIILVWMLRLLWSIETPGEVAAAFTTVLSFGCAWLTKESTS